MFNSPPLGSFARRTGYHNLAPAQFAAGAHQPEAVLVDVRRPHEYAWHHLPGAVNCDVQAENLDQFLAMADMSTPVYLYCRSGARSAGAARRLVEAGFEQVYILLGGILDWPYAVAR